MSQLVSPPQEANDRPGLPANALTLPARYYTDAGYFAREMEKVYFSRWIHAGRTAQISEPGDYFLLQLAGESLVILRDEAEGLRGFYNVCRHRGTRICREMTGRLPGRLQCPYHAWTYRYDGTLANAPYMEKTPGFAKQDHSLQPVAVDTWDGHIFIHLGEPERSLAEQLDHLPERFSHWGMADLRRAHRVVYSLQTNWKLIIQNYSECLHCPLLHPQLQRLSH